MCDDGKGVWLRRGPRVFATGSSSRVFPVLPENINDMFELVDPFFQSHVSLDEDVKVTSTPFGRTTMVNRLSSTSIM